MIMNLIILRKKWSGQNRTGRTGSASTAQTTTVNVLHPSLGKLKSALSVLGRWCPVSAFPLARMAYGCSYMYIYGILSGGFSWDFFRWAIAATFLNNAAPIIVMSAPMSTIPQTSTPWAITSAVKILLPRSFTQTVGTPSVTSLSDSRFCVGSVAELFPFLGDEAWIILTCDIESPDLCFPSLRACNVFGGGQYHCTCSTWERVYQHLSGINVHCLVHQYCLHL